ncbi:hypothetical protein EV359DRAFT_41354, partial [Lentinula novae-zelandiae]
CPSLCHNKSILELGAGGALPSFVAAECGARKVVITDYPDPDLIQNIEYNIRENADVVNPLAIFSRLRSFSGARSVLNKLQLHCFYLRNRPHYNVISQYVDTALENMGATQMGICGEGDDDKSMEEDYLGKEGWNVGGFRYCHGC